MIIMGEEEEEEEHEGSTRVPIDTLERHLLSHFGDGGESQGDEPILYSASFEQEAEEAKANEEMKFVRYQTAQWVLYSVVLILAWGIGLLMLLYLPIRIYNCKREFRSKKLYLTSNAIVYKVSKPLFLPCFGYLHKQKYILLPSISDVIVEQGYLQSHFGVSTIRIEHKGVRRPATDDVNIQGVPLPTHFQKAVLAQLSTIKKEQFGKQASTSSAVPSGDLIFQKLDEVDGSLKKVHALIETKVQASQILD